MNQKLFSDYTGISSATLSGVLNGKSNPTLAIVESIKEHFPQLSLDWLINGTGPMYKDEAPQNASADTAATSGTTAPGQSPLLDFSTPSSNVQGAAEGPAVVPGKAQMQKTMINYLDKPARKIVEIRVFYDDQTFESFVPKK